MTRKPVVYRVYDADDRLIYIGSTVNLDLRMGTHRHQSWWIRLAARIEVEPHDDLASARIAEVSAIRSESPAFNRQYVSTPWNAPLALTTAEVAVCRAWVREKRDRVGFLPLALRWVAEAEYPELHSYGRELIPAVITDAAA